MQDAVIYTLLVCGALALLGFLGDRLFQRTGIPDVLLLLLVGVLIGPVSGLVDPSQLSRVTPFFGTLALLFILFDGGLELDFDEILRQFLPVIVLTLLSIVTAMAGLACLLVYGFDWEWLPALLLSSFLANTSGPIVLPVVNRLTIREEDKAILKLEAAASDVIVILLFVTFLSILQAIGVDGGRTEVDVRSAIGKLAGSFSIAIVIGIVTGAAWMAVLNRIHEMRHNYMATLGALLMLYSVSEYVGASGMMAVLFFGIVLANSRKFGQFFNLGEIRFADDKLKHFHATFSFFIRTFFLVYIGFFISADMFRSDFLVMGWTSVGVLVAGRLVTAFAFAGSFRKPKSTRWAVAAMLPRGLAVAALAAVPAQEVDRMVRERQAALSAEERALEDHRKNLADLQPQREATEKSEDKAALAAVKERELALAAEAHASKAATERHKTLLGSLHQMQRRTDLFVLFASLSILVTNVLMTLGCFVVQRAARAEAAIVPPVAPPAA